MWYKLDGGDYLTFSGSTPLNAGAVVSAYATRSGYIPSAVATGTFSQVVATLSPASFSGVYTGGATYPITADCGTADVTIGWSHSARGSGTAAPGGTISIAHSGTQTVTATMPGYVPSAPTTGLYTFTPEAPTIGGSVTPITPSLLHLYPEILFHFERAVVYEYSLDGGAWTAGTVNYDSYPMMLIPTADLSDVVQIVIVRICDPATGFFSANSNSYGFNFDSTPPEVGAVTINCAPIANTYAGTIMIRAECTEYAFICLDGSGPLGGTVVHDPNYVEVTFSTIIYTDGTHTITVRDQTYNSAGPWTFAIDNW